jgi:hypothetical protein
VGGGLLRRFLCECGEYEVVGWLGIGLYFAKPLRIYESNDTRIDFNLNSCMS